MDLAKVALVASMIVFETYWIAGALLVVRFFDLAHPGYNAFLSSVVESLQGLYLLAAICVIVRDGFIRGWAYVLPEGLALVIGWLIFRGVHDDRWKRRRRRLRARVRRVGARRVSVPVSTSAQR